MSNQTRIIEPTILLVQFSSVSVMSDSLWPHGLQHASLPQLSELAHTHVHHGGDAIQTSHPLQSPSPASNLSQHQGLFNEIVLWLHQVTKELELLLQHQFFQWIFIQDWSPLGWTGWTSLQSKGLSRVFPNSTVQKHQVFGFPFGSTLTSIPGYWKSHSLD